MESARRRYNKIIVFLILLAFLLPFYNYVKWGVRILENAQDIVVSGKYIRCSDGEEDELYQWIKKNTSQDSIFLDSTLLIPVFAQRRLYIGIQMKKRLPGFGRPLERYLRYVYCYDAKLLDNRYKIAKDIYDTSKSSMDIRTRHFLESGESNYIVARTDAIADKFEREGLTRVFCSSNRRFHVYNPL